MGWSFNCSASIGRKQLIEQLRDPSRFSAGCTIVRSSVVGNHHWYLLRDPKGNVSIGLDLMAGGGKGSGWGYKSLDESSGPYYFDCPLSFLDEASAPTHYAAEWRESARKHHAAKAAIKPRAGLVVMYGGHQYKLVRPAGPRKGWEVIALPWGGEYRMKAAQLAKSTIQQGEAS